MAGVYSTHERNKNAWKKLDWKTSKDETIWETWP